MGHAGSHRVVRCPESVHLEFLSRLALCVISCKLPVSLCLSLLICEMGIPSTSWVVGDFMGSSWPRAWLTWNGLEPQAVIITTNVMTLPAFFLPEIAHAPCQSLASDTTGDATFCIHPPPTHNLASIMLRPRDSSLLLPRLLSSPLFSFFWTCWGLCPQNSCLLLATPLSAMAFCPRSSNFTSAMILQSPSIT